MNALQEEKLHENGSLAVPGGIHLCQLPFVDDVRAHDLSSTISVVRPPGWSLSHIVLKLAMWRLMHPLRCPDRS